jgi:hypothetical protein
MTFSFYQTTACGWCDCYEARDATKKAALLLLGAHCSLGRVIMTVYAPSQNIDVMRSPPVDVADIDREIYNLWYLTCQGIKDHRRQYTLDLYNVSDEDADLYFLVNGLIENPLLNDVNKARYFYRRLTTAPAIRNYLRRYANQPSAVPPCPGCTALFGGYEQQRYAMSHPNACQ